MFRSLRKIPGVSVLTLLTLALGIGSSATVFSLIEGVLLTPPPYPHPDRVTLITPARADGQRYTRGWSAAQWQEWQKESKSFEAIAGYSWTFNYLVLPDGSESVEGMWVTPDYFNVAGIRPVLGRPFDGDDARTRPTSVVILGNDLWRRRFNANPEIVGQTIRISRFRQPLTVVGVMPPEVRFLPSPGESQEPNYNVDAKVDYWLPAGPDPKRLKDPEWDIVGRLRPGASLDEAQAEIAGLTARQAGSEAEFAGIVPKLQPLEARMNQEGRRLLLPMAGAVALVFLIACANAAGLLLARGLQRQREYAVRAALGARPWQLCRPILTESVLLALVGGLLGVGLAMGSVAGLKLIGSAAIPRLDAVQIGWPVLGFGLMAAVAAGLIAGLLPASRSLAQEPAGALKAGGRTASMGLSERRLLGGVAAIQIALTLALLVGAGLLIQSVNSLARVRPGYDTQNVLTMSVTAVGTNWLDFHTRAIERVARLPGVTAAAFGWGVPLTGNKWNTTFELPGAEEAGSLKSQLNLPTRSVTPDYFAALGLKLVEGRAFRESDNEQAPRVVIVNQAAVDRFLAGRNAIGQKLHQPGRPTNFVEIVGVLANTRTDSLTDAAEPELYFSFWQSGAFSKHLVLRVAGDPRAIGLTVQRELRNIDPTVAVENVKTLEEIREGSVAARTFAMNLLIGFALVACLLATIGIYGVVSLAAGSRQSEIAIRMALGAQRNEVFRLILGDGVRLAGVGIALGLLVSLSLATGLRTFLFGIGPTDPLTWVVMVAAVLGITVVTCWIPARRATRVEPAAALKID